MGEYAKIQKRIWNSRTFHQLSEDGKFLWFYILTCPHNNLIGLFVLKPGYAQGDLGWTPQRFNKVFTELLETPSSNGCKGLIEYDPEACLILIKNYLEHNPLKNPNQIKSAISKLNDLPFSPLFQRLKLLVEQLGKQLYEPLIEQLGKPITIPITIPVTNTNTELASPNNNGECPHKEIVDLWNKKMVPLGLLKVREWGMDRRGHLKSRWHEKKERQDLEWWEKLFDYIPKCPFLMGKIEPGPGHKKFLVSLPWLVASEEKLSKVIEGFYQA